jgi:predicted HTH domain antitoxin
MKTISLRLDEKTLKKTSEIAEAQNLERSDTLRQSISAGLEMLSKKIAVEKYSEGKFSLSEAASFARVSAGEMIELLAQKGIKANYTLKEAEESYNRIGKFLEK